MRPAATGRPGTRVIPDGWADAHQTALAGTRTATVALRHARTTRDPAAPYAAGIPARIQALLAGGKTAEVASDTVSVRGYLVTLPLDQTAAAVKAGDLIDVTTADDPQLTGMTLHVQDVVRGSLLFERDIFCTLDN